MGVKVQPENKFAHGDKRSKKVPEIAENGYRSQNLGLRLYFLHFNCSFFKKNSDTP